MPVNPLDKTDSRSSLRSVGMTTEGSGKRDGDRATKAGSAFNWRRCCLLLQGFAAEPANREIGGPRGLQMQVAHVVRDDSIINEPARCLRFALPG